jgi:hypothetical protein
VTFAFCASTLNAQNGQNERPVLPLKRLDAPVFGKDIIIHDQPNQNQRQVALCSAFNGWLYAAYSYFDHNVQEAAVTILRSKDSGVNWSTILDGTIGLIQTAITSMDILVCGHDTANLKVFVGYCVFDTATSYHFAWVVRYNGNTGEFEDEILNEFSENVRDIALAGDENYPATNSNPFSIGVIYSKRYVSDSIVFCSSGNGGITFDSHYSIASSSHYFDKVSLAFGRSPSYSSGRYFAAWEEQQNENSIVGHIYTSHSEPDFNSPFNTPYLLDSLDITTSNNGRNPVIACQNNERDNDSTNLTEVILFEKYQPTIFNFSIAGFYNKRSTISNNFQKFILSDSANNIIQPDICFNQFDSTFIVTCFDSTDQKLPWLNNDYNITDPDHWFVVSQGYNDDNNLVKPYPQVQMDFGKHTGANVWIGEGDDANGMAMFDSPYTYYTGIPKKSNPSTKLILRFYPNPATSFTILEFELKQPMEVEVTIENTLSQRQTGGIKKTFTSGKQQVKIDLTELLSGIYIFTLHAGDDFASGKIYVTR